MGDPIEELAETLGGSGSAIRGFTHGRILKAIARQVGGGVRRGLAERLDVSAATVSKAVTQMIALRLVGDEPSAVGQGRTVVPLALTRDFAVTGIAVVAREGRPNELIGTVTTLDGTPFDTNLPVRRRQLKPDALRDSVVFLDELADFAEELAEIQTGTSVMLGYGITIAGYVDSKSGGIIRTFGTEWDKDQAVLVRDRLQEKLNRRVVVDNDITSLAVRKNLRPLQESSIENYALIAPIDCGVGGAMVIDGKTWLGAHGMAGEPGHIPASSASVAIQLPDAPRVTRLPIPRCQCESSDTAREDAPDGLHEQLGHVEAFASPVAIKNRAIQLGLMKSQHDLGKLAAHPRSDIQASMLFYQGGLALGTAVVSILNWFDPERVLIYLPEHQLHQTNTYLAGSYYLEGLRNEVRQNAVRKNADNLLEIYPTTEDEMHERLASAAGYLVFRELIQRISAKRPSR